MNNIDLSLIMTAQAKADAQHRAHSDAIKAACKQRILHHMPYEAQQNITQAMTAYTSAIVGGTAPGDAILQAGLASAADLVLIKAGREWVAAMQVARREMSDDVQTDPQDGAIWPDFPQDVAQLVSRF